jgi:DNA-binding winged helix-turn-helix (wHTH) protein/tetratricopeptide (TPR) repeat protein
MLLSRKSAERALFFMNDIAFPGGETRRQNEDVVTRGTQPALHTEGRLTPAAHRGEPPGSPPAHSSRSPDRTRRTFFDPLKGGYTQAMPPEPTRSERSSDRRSDFQVGDRLVRPGLNRIEGPSGPMTVEPRVMEVLVHLAGRRGEVVSKEELVREVWEGRFVSDDVVWRSIRELRRALGDDARSATWIQTIPKRGYLLAAPEPASAPPQVIARAEAPQLVPRRFLGVALLLGFTLLAAIVLLGVRGLGPVPPALSSDPAAVQNPAAHDAVLRGRYFLGRGMPADLSKSADAFREAVALDPVSAPAWAGLAEALHLQTIFGIVPPREGIPPAEEAARKALTLDDSLSETHATLGTILFRYHWRWVEAEAEMRRALELDPRSGAARHDLAWLLVADGRFDEAITEINAARELEPLSVRSNADVGWVYYRARRYDEAIRQMERTLEMEPRFLSARRCLERALADVGRMDEALRHAREGAGQEGMTASDLAALPSEPAAALRKIAKWRLEHLESRERSAHVSPYTLAALHADLGDQESALAELARALEERDSMLVSAEMDPAFDPVRSDPRFLSIIEQVGGPASRRPS